VPRIDPAPMKNVTTKVVLPEYAVIREIHTPDYVKVDKHQEIHNLDIHGRPVVEVSIDRMSSQDDIQLEIIYDLDRVYGLIKPFTLSAALFSAMLSCIVLRRVNFLPKSKKD